MNGSPPCCIALQQGGVVLSQYDVFRDGQVVGKVTLTVQGLYYRISCRCTTCDGIVRLVDRCSNGTVEIGVCAPVGERLGIDRCVPIKLLGQGPHAFSLTARKKDGAVFCRISGEEPCGFLQKLERVRFARENGVPGLLVIPQETDPHMNPAKDSCPL